MSDSTYWLTGRRARRAGEGAHVAAFLGVPFISHTPFPPLLCVNGVYCTLISF